MDFRAGPESPPEALICPCYVTRGFNSCQHLDALELCFLAWQLSFPVRAKFKADQWAVGKWEEEISYLTSWAVMTGSYTIMEEADPVTKRGDREGECMGNKDSFRNK